MAAAAWVISFRRCLSAAFSNADATAKSSKQKVETLARMARTSTSTNRIRYDTELNGIARTRQLSAVLSSDVIVLEPSFHRW